MAQDHQQLQALAPYPVETLTVPLLAVHSPSDPLAPFEQAVWLTSTAPHATLLEVAVGGHPCFMVRHEAVMPAVAHFLNDACPV